MNTFKVICVYDMMLVLLKLNSKMLVKCSCTYILIETADDEITPSITRTVYVIGR